MKWLKLYVFSVLGIDFAGRRRVLRVMREYVQLAEGEEFKPRGMFSWPERFAIAFFCTLVRAPVTMLLLPPMLLLTILAVASQALGLLP